MTDGQIRNRASENSWARGRSYVDRVHDIVWRDGELAAHVDGSDWAVALEPALVQAQAMIDHGHIERALALLQVATEAWAEGAEALDDYVYEYFFPTCKVA